MMRDLVYLPSDLFGFGWVFAIWLAGSLGLLAWSVARRGWREAVGYLPVLAIVGGVIVWVLPALAGENGLPVRGFGAMLVLGIVSSVWLAMRLARRSGIDPETILGMSFWVILSGIAGARIFYVVEYWDEFRSEAWGEMIKNLVNVTEGGLVVYGAALGGFTVMAGFLWLHRLPVLAVADICAPAIGLGLFFGRIGCFLNGCCYGGVSDLPWAVQFPLNSPPYLHQLQRGEIGVHGLRFSGSLNDPARIAEVQSDSPAAAAGLRSGQRVLEINGVAVQSIRQADAELLRIKPGEPIAVTIAGEPAAKTWVVAEVSERSLPIHPTQLYSAGDGLILCLFLLAYFPYRRRDGEVIALLLTIYPITRFLIEIIRDDEGTIAGTDLTISQNVSLICLGVAAALWLFIASRPARTAMTSSAPAN